MNMMIEISQDVIVKTLRALQGEKSQEEFAHELGISQPLLSHLYSGDRRPSLTVLRALRKRYPETQGVIDSYLAS